MNSNIGCDLNLFVWGLCDDGQLIQCNDSENYQIAAPKLINPSRLPKFIQVSCGYKHTLLLTDDAEVYSCGSNEFHQLGHKESSTSLSKLLSLEKYRIISVVCGAYHSAAISYNGNLFTWGCNLNGQLGREGDDTRVKLVRLLSEHRVIQASLGVEHTLILTETSHVFAFGANSKGQLGVGYVSEYPLWLPQQISCLSGLPIKQIVAGGWHSLVVTVSGSVYAWGSNNRGQLGLGFCDSEPNDKPLHSRRPSSATGVSHSCIVVPTVVKLLNNLSVVYVACGESHTAALTRSGRVFTFGYGKHGQLGCNKSLNFEPSPVELQMFIQCPAYQIACGRNHTFVLTPGDGILYAFGAGTDGQLGSGDNSNRIYPNVVAGPWTAASQFPNEHNERYSCNIGPHVIKRIFTGGDHVYMLAKLFVNPTNDVADDLRIWNRHSLHSILNICPELCGQLRDSLKALPLPAPTSRPNSSSLSSNSLLDHPTFTKFKTASAQIINVFSSLGCLASSCLQEGELNNHFKTGRTQCGMDLDSAQILQSQIFQLLSSKDLHLLITNLMEKVLSVSSENYPNIECLRGYMFLTVSDFLNIPSKPMDSKDIDRGSQSVGSRNSGVVNLGPSRKSSILFIDDNRENSGPFPILRAGFHNPCYVLSAFCMAINKLDPAPSKIIDQWLLNVQPRYLKRLVWNLNDMVTYILRVQTKTTENQRYSQEDDIKRALEFMKRLHRVNEAHSTPISYSNFYIPILKEKLNLGSAFVHWLKDRNGVGMRFFSFFDYPFVFNASSKAEMLSIEARLTMQEAMTQAQQNAILHTVIAPLFTGRFVPMADPYFSITVKRNHIMEDTLTCLTVADPRDFKKLLRVKFENEEAVDEGGVMKEFFLLVMRDLLNPVYGMFKCYPESRMLWFSESTMESENMFSMVGILCGLAIYNSIIIDLSFSLALFHKLLGERTTLDDLKELDPTTGRSLQQLLDYEHDDLEEVVVDYFGTSKVIPLIDNGENVMVNQSNKALYVEKYVEYVFDKSCDASYKAFEKGFNQVCGGYTLKLFRPMELQALVVGSEAVDWNDLRQNTTYEGVFWDRHPVIQWFWEVLLIEFSVEDKKKFLRFLTGCDRVPVVGFSGLKITIQPHNGGNAFLPAAHTCANLLDLPIYSSKSILSKKLYQAIHETEGFGLV